MRYILILFLFIVGCGEDAKPIALVPTPELVEPTLIGHVDLTTNINHYGARYPSVIRDPKTGIYRMYHLVELLSPEKHLYYAESTDGIHFEPKGELFSVPNLKMYGAEVSFDTHANRYVLAYHTNPGNLPIANQFESHFAYSDNGVDFTPDLTTSFRPSSTASDSPTLPIFNPVTNLYQLMIRPVLGDREVSMIQSADLMTWNDAIPVFQKHIEDNTQIQYYGMPTFKVDNHFVGFLLRMETPIAKAGSATGRYQTYLATSEDGIHWTADETKPFLASSTIGHPFDLNASDNVYGSGAVEATSLLEMPDGSYNIYASAFLVDHSLLVKQRLAGTAPTQIAIYNISKADLLQRIASMKRQ